ncbi:hypothetical protein BT69DRAFT_1291638 [Atractiella rhizophila]|nr:hypothetical protein BT69DRAFT_1291638 [Atractiella rhizophila]
MAQLFFDLLKYPEARKEFMSAVQLQRLMIVTIYGGNRCEEKGSDAREEPLVVTEHVSNVREEGVSPPGLASTGRKGVSPLKKNFEAATHDWGVSIQLGLTVLSLSISMEATALRSKNALFSNPKGRSLKVALHDSDNSKGRGEKSLFWDLFSQVVLLPRDGYCTVSSSQHHFRTIHGGKRENMTDYGLYCCCCCDHISELSDYSQRSSTFGDITCEKMKMLTVQQSNLGG